MGNPHALLPSSPLSLCEDRFSILPSEDDSQFVPAWPLITAVINSPAHTVDDLMNHLETLAISLHGHSTDLGNLRNFLNHHLDSADFLRRVYPVLVGLALDLPILFPEGVIPFLSRSSPSCILTRRQIASLVVHQFLCTLSPPSWLVSDCSSDFHIWYSSSQSHPGAIHAYLTALFTYFERLASETWITYLSASEWPITLNLRSMSRHPSELDLELRFGTLTINELPTASTQPSLLGIPSGACVISANKYIGFGRTGTQEETHVGCSPEACPTLLFVPPLQDDQVLVLEGVEAMVTIEGYGRDAILGQVLPADYTRDTCHASSWRRRTMLFMDALELDLYDGEGPVADLLPGHLDRELNKAYNAFSSREDDAYSVIITGLWGCGSFGGNAEIKTILQWCAASMAGVPLTFVCNSDNQSFLHRLRDFLRTTIQQGWTVTEVLSTLQLLRPEDEAALHAFTHTSERLTRYGKQIL